MISVGLTGGIGSGKSLIAQFFTILKVPVYNSDFHAKLLMEENTLVRNQIQDLLGHEAYVNNKLNKSFVANKIFSNDILINSLNSIVHKYVLQDYMKWTENQSSNHYVIQEAAILFETGHYKKHNLMITVSCPLEIRKKRLLELGKQPEDIDQRISNQWSDEERNKLADFVIVNNEKESILKQVYFIHNKILNSKS